MAENQATNPEAADILVVDDDIASLKQLAELLSQEGYRVKQAEAPEAALQAARAHLPDLILLDVKLPGMSGAKVIEANLQGAYLLGADLRRAKLLDANLRGADLRGADLRGAYLFGADLRRADLREAILRGANLSATDLREASLIDANLQDFLHEADLREANLPMVYLEGADLREARLLGADLHEANLHGANLLGADLRRAKLIDANLREAMVTDEQLAQAKTLEGATMPDGTKFTGATKPNPGLPEAEDSEVQPDQPGDLDTGEAGRA